MLARGEVIGRYEVLCPLGSGGMATVYAARVRGEAAFEKLVALKLMLPHLAGDEKFVRMFVDEARVAGQVQSAHVVATLDLGRVPERGLLYQVLELVLGASLRQILDAQAERAAPLDLDVALAILVQAARGLADAHAARSMTGSPLGLVHRDVSPHNVLLGIDGRARLSDFGVARAAARVSQTESGELKGKLAYASPEQLRGEIADARSDVFALGIVAWETLAGRRLFDGDNPLAIVDRLMTQPIPRVSSVREDVPAEIADVIAEALVREPGDRLVSATAFADRIERAAQGRIAPQSRVAEVVRELAGARVAQLERTIAEQVAASEAPTMARARRPRRGAWIAGGIAIAVVAGAAAWRVVGEAGGGGETGPVGAAVAGDGAAEAGTGAEIGTEAETETETEAETETETEAEVEAVSEVETAEGREVGEPAEPRGGRTAREGARGGGRRREGARPDEGPAPVPDEIEAPAVGPAEPAGPALLGVDAFDRQDGDDDEPRGDVVAP